MALCSASCYSVWVELADRRGLDPEFALRQALSRRLNERNHA